MNTTDTPSHGVARYVVEEVLYGTPSPPQKTVFSDEVLDKVKNVTELVGKIETGELQSPRTVTLRRRSTALQNSPKLTERIARMRCDKVEPSKACGSWTRLREIREKPLLPQITIQPEEIKTPILTKSEEPKIHSPVSNLVGKIESGTLKPTKPVTLRRISTGLKNSPKLSERIARMRCKQVESTEEVAEEFTNHHISSEKPSDSHEITRISDIDRFIDKQFDFNGTDEVDFADSTKLSSEPVETPILSKSSKSPKDFSVLFDTTDGQHLTLHETPILRSRNKPAIIRDGTSNRFLDFDNKLKSPEPSKVRQEFFDENVQETPILRPMIRQESGLTIINRIESETKLAALKEKQLSDTESNSSSSAYSSATESTSPDSQKQIEEFTYSKLARAQLHRKFGEYYKWDMETLRSVSSAVSQIRFDSLSAAEKNQRVSIVMDIYHKCTENANKELYALGCALFALCDDVGMSELTSAEEYCAEKFRRRNAQKESGKLAV